VWQGQGGEKMKKEDVLKIIDEVMNNREIDSIRNAILAIRDKVIDYDDWTDNYTATLILRGKNPLRCYGDYFEGATKICIDTTAKNDTRDYGGYWYE
jgi:hypothetical protein